MLYLSIYVNSELLILAQVVIYCIIMGQIICFPYSPRKTFMVTTQINLSAAVTWETKKISWPTEQHGTRCAASAAAS